MKNLYLYQRKTKKGDIFYVQFVVNGTRQPGRSSGKSTKDEARKWTENQIESGLIGVKTLRFDKFIEDFFIWGKCRYIEEMRALGRYKKRSRADYQRRYLKLHILPYFKHFKLKQITRKIVKEWHMKFAKSSPSTGNRAKSVLNTIMAAALDRGLIQENPVKGLTKLDETEARNDRGILTEREFHLLFSENALQEVWEGDLFFYTANLLAGVCALRMGEVLALTWSDIKKELLFKTGEILHFLTIQHSWDRKYGLTQPKGRRVCVVSLEPVTVDCLNELYEILPYKNTNDFIFYGKDYLLQDEKKPIDNKSIIKRLYRALNRIGIDEDIRKERNLSFHGLRHYAISYTRKLSENDQYIRDEYGHKDATTSDGYTHLLNSHLLTTSKIKAGMVTRKGAAV